MVPIFEDNDYKTYSNISHCVSSAHGPLALVAAPGNEDMVDMINRHIYDIRKKRVELNPRSALDAPGYMRSSYILDGRCVRFSSGEGKAQYNESVRGHDVTILTDITNRFKRYKLFGQELPYSPDDHFVDLKRLILALSGKASRINVVMPYLYEAKQDNRLSRESLDCALALKELKELGVHSIFCFEAHEPRVENAIPELGIENYPTSYMMIEKLLEDENGIVFDNEHLAIVSPDEGGMKRAVYYSSVLGLQLSTFYRQRDYSTVIDGRNPITDICFLGDEVAGKDVLVVDDMISTGLTMLQTAKQLKEKLGARRVFCACTFPLFTQGIQAFDEAYESGLISKVYGTNLIHHSEALKTAPWYVDTDASRFIAKIIDAVNHDFSTSNLMNQTERINELLENRQQMLEFLREKK
ncbi:MAG: ribose-phosphate pyrophosphokinase [Eubacteriales bacterium]|nr:ribose-phosphate pyrophosphokinase [Eubacteriales bacterium]